MALAQNTFANAKLVEKAKKDKAKLVFDRFEEQQPQCKFGMGDICCKICHQGPCRIIPGKQEKGICGATADTITARNWLRHTAAGVACHTGHAKEGVMALLEIAEGKTRAYKITDEAKLRSIAKKLKIKHTGPIKQVAKDFVHEVLEDFRRQKGVFEEKEEKNLNYLMAMAPPKRIKKWEGLGIVPYNADAQIASSLHQTAMGCDADPTHLWLETLRMGLIDGYSGLLLASDVQDIIFGTPKPVVSTANLGTMEEDCVNLAVHGHVPLLSEKIVEWAKKLEKEAKKVGARKVNVIGLCCTGNEVLMRQGIPLAGHVLQQELLIVTGACEAMVVDTQCIYPSVTDVAQCYHTKAITTLDLVRIPGAIHMPFSVEHADKVAKEIVMVAIKNFKNRKGNIYIPKEKRDIVAGFSAEAIVEALSKLNKKDPLKPLIDNIVNGNILGIVAVVGCRNAKLRGQKFGERLMEILLKNNILVVATGCMAHAAAQEGMMDLKSTAKFAGPKLKAVLDAIGQANGLPTLPAVLHMGSCVDNGRIGTVLNAVAERLGVDISDLPVAGSAPEYVTEKAVAIGTWVLDMGVSTHLNPVPPVTESPFAVQLLTKDLEKLTGSKVLLGTTPEDAAKVIIDHIKKKRKKLGLK